MKGDRILKIQKKSFSGLPGGFFFRHPLFRKQRYNFVWPHVTRLGNDSYQKQILCSCDRKKFTRDRWVKIERELNLSTVQIQYTMRNKKEFMSLLNTIYK